MSIKKLFNMRNMWAYFTWAYFSKLLQHSSLKWSTHYIDTFNFQLSNESISIIPFQVIFNTYMFMIYNFFVSLLEVTQNNVIGFRRRSYLLVTA